MPSPTEQQPSAETLTLPLKDSMEQSPEIEIVSHVNDNDPDDPDEPHDDDEVTNFDDNQQSHEEQQQTQQVTTTTSTSDPSSPSEIIKSTDIVTDDNDNNDNANVTSSTTSPPAVENVENVENVNNSTSTTATTSSPPTISNTENTTTQDVKQEDATTQQDTTTQDTSDISKSSSVNGGQKRKYTKRVTNDSHTQRRRTRNNSKSGSINSDEQSTMVSAKRTPTSSAQVTTTTTTTTTTSRRSNVDPTSPPDFSGSNGRKLPSREGINQTNISDRFVDFIMYCNPSAPETLDKAALVRSFNAVPKSDGKVFQTWSLYQLVGKHYAGEIRTWTKLAQKLGVVRTPEASPQKIQQYAVRLKKWMASVHVDAYFDYLLSRANEYYQHPNKNPTEGTDDESDVVLKLIKRAGSKRQKRKYTRKNTNASNTSNDDGAHSRDAMDLDDDAQFESDDEGDDKHRGKRVKGPMYSDDENDGTEEEDRDPWGEMEVDDGEERPTESTGPTNQTNQTNQRRKSVVQFAIEPKNGSDIPTPNPSPTTASLPIMSHSSGNVTGNKGVLNSHFGTTGGASKYRWRYISTGPAHAVKSSDESYLTTSSPSSSQKDSKKKQDTSQVRQSSTTRPSRNVPNEQQQQQQQQQKTQNFADLLVTRTGSNDKETIDILQQKLVSAVGMLEDSQRQINMLNGLVRQRDEDVRQRVVRALKTEVNSVFDRFH